MLESLLILGNPVFSKIVPINSGLFFFESEIKLARIIIEINQMKTIVCCHG
jgi:hypothetical protein